MLVFGRKVGESIIINGNIEVILCKIDGRIAKIGVNAPREITINRNEIEEKKKKSKQLVESILSKPKEEKDKKEIKILKKTTNKIKNTKK